jgi:CHAT domain-containing protein
MSRARHWAYLDLIQKLLQSDDGDENDLLDQHRELVDTGLVSKMLVVAELLSHRKDPEDNEGIQYLRDFSDHLSLSLNPTAKEKTDALILEIDFFIIALATILEEHENPGKIHLLFQANSLLLNEQLIEEIQSWTSNELLNTDQDDKYSIARLVLLFGSFVLESPWGIPGINIEIAIASFKISLNIYTRCDYPDEWAEVHNNLAVAYADRELGEKQDNIEISINYYLLVLEVYSRHKFPYEWARTKSNLASTYANRILGNRSENIELAIQYYKAALEVRTRKNVPHDWAKTKSNLANIYANRILGNKLKNVELAIQSYKDVLKVISRKDASKQWAIIQYNLANAYKKREKGKKANNIELAIKHYRLSIEIYTRESFPMKWAMAFENLATSYGDRIIGDTATNIEIFIEYLLIIMEVCTYEDHPFKWAQVQNNLVSAYTTRILGNAAENIELSLQHARLALKVRTAEKHPKEWAATQNNVANAYTKRIQGEISENLEMAIQCYKSALNIYTKKDCPLDWAGNKNNLASAYTKRIRGERSENLELAIQYYKSALNVYTEEDYPLDWAMTQNNLAIAYKERIKGKRKENIELAIQSYQLSLKIYTRQNFPQEYARTQNNLANSYLERIEGDKSSNMEKAISYYLQSLKIYKRKKFPQQWATTQNNLANAYCDRLKGIRINNLRLAIKSYRSSLDILTCDNNPRYCRQTACGLGNLYFTEQQWKLANNTYRMAFDAANNLYQSCILLDSKTDELKEFADLPRQIAYCFARTDETQKAVEILEQNRARGLSESLDRDRANLTQLQQINNELYEKYRNITNQLRSIEAQQRDRITSTERHSLTPETMRDTATHLRQQLDDLIQAIRQVEGYENFLALPTFADVRHAISQIDRPLIYLLCTSAGSLALIVTPENINTVWCDNFTETQLATLIETWFAAYNQRQTNHSAWLNTIDAVTRQLWEPLMAPLLDQLAQQQIDRAVLIPTGYLSLLPLHAAWTGDPQAPSGRQYVIDRIHFTYAPNAKSLTAAQAIATKTIGNDILAIDNPTQDPKLPNAQREVQQVTSYFEQPKILQGATAQAATVLEQLPNYQYIHLACHGTADLNEPLKSGLQMSDRLLSLKEFLALKLGEDNSSGIRLAVLSACETALPGTENTDEAISLPTGLLQAGVAGIIASLWAVDDSRTMLLLTKFYELWQGAAALPIDVALYQSQLWLRNITEKDLAALIGQRTLTPEKYQHLYYWAAFSYTGI